ncbi:MAG: glycosyltransferase, partial [Planctomycetales bacterium]|nr:glycosyltransferase [Planctomycetales bacterium]
HVLKSPCLRHWGNLNLACPKDRLVHCNVLNRSHWLLQPSLAEAYGIAPCEAAHFGRPSIVANVGGLPTVVLHQQTGLVMAVEATPDQYAQEIEHHSIRTDEYHRLSENASRRARETLNWDECCSHIVDLFHRISNKKMPCQLIA